MNTMQDGIKYLCCAPDPRNFGGAGYQNGIMHEVSVEDLRSQKPNRTTKRTRHAFVACLCKQLLQSKSATQRKPDNCYTARYHKQSRHWAKMTKLKNIS